jgi:hypothetical protein
LGSLTTTGRDTRVDSGTVAVTDGREELEGSGMSSSKGRTGRKRQALEAYKDPAVVVIGL